MPVKEEVCLWPDDQLLSSLQLDDRKAFEIIYNKYAHKLYAVAYNLLRDKEVCQDILQELFIELWLKRHTLHIESLQAYLKIATRNRVLMYIRSNKAALSLDVVDSLVAKYHTDGQLLRKDLSNALDTNIAKLPEKCRRIFNLSRKEQLSNKEIANLLNISIKTVENQITIALRYLRAGLSDFLPLILIALFGIY